MFAIATITITLVSFGLGNIFVLDNAMTRMIEFMFTAPFCAMHYDRAMIQETLLGSDPKKVRQISNDLVKDWEKVCHDSLLQGKNRLIGDGLMYPGTKWCGPGNVAKTYDDLGKHKAEDKLCRKHDSCNRKIWPGQCTRGICNKSDFVRNHCDCDEEFRTSLQNLNTEVSNTVGAWLFNVIQITCFTERAPCTPWQKVGLTKSEVKAKCSKYIFRPSDKYVPMRPFPKI